MTSFNGMPWQQQYPNKFPASQQQHGGSSRGSMLLDGGGDMQEMHLKMSKKIAQLTKVIYALNTKNDEHETTVAHLKESHEEEIQTIIASYTTKLHEVQKQKNQESDLKRKVENLQQQVSTFQIENVNVKETIERLKHANQKRETEMEEEHLKTIETLTCKLRDAKNGFDSRVADFQRSLAQVEREKSRTDDSKSVEHQRQISDLKRKLDSQELNFAKRISEVEEERDRLRMELGGQVEALERELSKTRCECDEKLDKAKEFYEHELDAARKSIAANESMVNEWKEKEHEMKVNSDKMESKYRKKVQDLGNELETRQDEIDELKSELNKHINTVEHTSTSAQNLNSELKVLKDRYEEVNERVTFLSNELDVAKMKMKSQVNDITQKSSIIGTLEAIKVTQDESIVDLEEQLKEKKQQLLKAEEDKNVLMNNKKDEEITLMEQLKAMTIKLDKIQKEKESAKIEHEKLLTQVKTTHHSEVDRIKTTYEHQVEDMERNHQLSIEITKKETDTALEELRKDLEENFFDEKLQLENNKEQEINKLSLEKNEICNNLEQLQEEMSKLRKQLDAKNKTNKEDKAKLELAMKNLEMITKNYEGGEEKYEQAQIMIQHLRRELEAARDKDEERKTEQRHIESLEKVKKDKDEEWEKIIRSKLSDMRSRLTMQLNGERRHALDELSREKDGELAAAKLGWQQQIQKLTLQISDIKSASRDEKEVFERKMTEMKHKFSNLELDFERKEKKIREDFDKEMEEMRHKYGEEMDSIREEKEKQIEDIKLKIAAKYKDELHVATKAHQISISAMREKIEQKHQDEIQQKEEEYQIDLEEVKCELMNRSLMQIDELRSDYEKQIQEIKEENNETCDRYERNEEEAKLKISELNQSLQLTSAELQELYEDKEERTKEISTLKKELELNVQDVLQARSEANLEIKRREEEIRKQFQEEQDNIQADQLRHKQNMVNEFNRATGLLKEKITELKITIHDLEDRFEKRESRPEDVEMITRLKDLVQEREIQIQQLMEDKKFYEMELVNRETNFNKVFNSSPTVGVLNPRNNSNKKKKLLNGGGQLTSGSNHKIHNNNNNNNNSQQQNYNNTTIETSNFQNTRLEPIRQQSPHSVTSSSGTMTPVLQPTPPTIPKKVVR